MVKSLHFTMGRCVRVCGGGGWHSLCSYFHLALTSSLFLTHSDPQRIRTRTAICRRLGGRGLGQRVHNQRMPCALRESGVHESASGDGNASVTSQSKKKMCGYGGEVGDEIERRDA